MNIQEIKTAFEELLPWERTEFVEWIKMREEFCLDNLDIQMAELKMEDIADKFTDEDFLHECSYDSIVDYVFDHGLEYDVIDNFDEKELCRYLRDYHQSTLKALSLEDIADSERDRIFDVAYGQGYRDGKNGKKMLKAER